MQKVGDELAQSGRRGHIIPVGRSNAIGSLGHVACVQEIHAQLFELPLRIDHAVVGPSSSGTHAGVFTKDQNDLHIHTGRDAVPFCVNDDQAGQNGGGGRATSGSSRGSE